MEAPRIELGDETLENKAWLETQIADLGVNGIAIKLDRSLSTVYKAIRRHGIDLRSVQRAAKIAPLIGRRFGMLTVQTEAPPRKKSGNIRVHADCDCGGSKIIAVWTLLNRGAGWDHCGCQSVARWRKPGQNSVHSHSKPIPSPTYRSWRAMRDRCYRPSTNGYASFGGRGIEVCERWRDNFAAFLEDMGERPPNHTLDRIDVDGNYEPENCRWATPAEQMNNRRRAQWLSARHWAVIEAALTSVGTSEATEVLEEIRRRGRAAAAARPQAAH